MGKHIQPIYQNFCVHCLKTTVQAVQIESEVYMVFRCLGCDETHDMDLQDYYPLEEINKMTGAL